MSKIKSVTVELGIKPSANYQSWHIDLAATADLEDDESMEQAISELTFRLKQQIATEHAQWKQEMGLP